MARDLGGKLVVVVGATGVLGARIAVHLAAAGASVFRYALADVTAQVI